MATSKAQREAVALRRAEKAAGVRTGLRDKARARATVAAWCRVVAEAHRALLDAEAEHFARVQALRAKRAKAIQGAHDHGASYRQIGGAMGVSHARAHLIHQRSTAAPNPKETST